MGQGLRLFNENGQIYFDTDMQPCRTLGSLYSKDMGDTGEIYIPQFATGTPWIIADVNFDDLLFEKGSSNGTIIINVWAEGNYLKWFWTGNDRNGKNYASYILYGVYY